MGLPRFELTPGEGDRDLGGQTRIGVTAELCAAARIAAGL